MTAAAGLERRDSKRLSPAADEIILVSCIRNEAVRLPYFLHYYRQLGVDRFLVIDNASNDGSQEFLIGQPDTHVFLAAGSYAESECGVAWINQLLQLYATERWVVVADADELLVYPDSERIGLRRLSRYLEQRGEQAMMTFLLDMYGAGPHWLAEYKRGASFLDACPCFDATGYEFPEAGPFGHIPLRGGVRKRLFFDRPGLRGKPPFLPKVPLVRWRDGLHFEASTHRLAAVEMAEITGALLHFKLFSDFAPRVRDEVQRREHWDGAAQYEAYGLALDAAPSLDPIYEGTMAYRGSLQLFELGLLRRPADYLDTA